ncbi:MAG: DegT/DnrJ/EryC1/StrS family aminotransferase [Planctomycetes bacterium]|nr:DegT/DnrJ/EryC1/StrS family aminotransferase [Planctomycetota bacterium]
MNQTQLTVPLLDLKMQYEQLRSEVEPMLREICDSQYFVLGPKVVELESEIASYIGTSRAVGCASGSDALLLALMALDVKAGDEVICPSYTFFATGGAIHRLGAIPIWADIDPVTYNMTPESVHEAAGKCLKLKAIMPVHLYGQTVDMDGMVEVGNSLGVPIIEDAAQAIGAKDATGAMAGSRGTIGCFSFYPTKNLGGFGDGGMVTTNDEALADRMAKLRVHGGERRYYHSEVGVNSRLDALQAGVLLIKLRYLESWHAARAKNASIYNEIFASAGDIGLVAPEEPAAPARHIWNQYILRVQGGRRDALREHLSQNDIGTDIYYPVPLHQQECFARIKGDALPNTELAALETVALPIFPELESQQVEYVANTIVDFLT